MMIIPVQSFSFVMKKRRRTLGTILDVSGKKAIAGSLAVPKLERQRVKGAIANGCRVVANRSRRGSHSERV
jgi:hypothetical protein